MQHHNTSAGPPQAVLEWLKRGRLKNRTSAMELDQCDRNRQSNSGCIGEQQIQFGKCNLETEHLEGLQEKKREQIYYEK